MKRQVSSQWTSLHWDNDMPRRLAAQRALLFWLIRQVSTRKQNSHLESAAPSPLGVCFHNPWQQLPLLTVSDRVTQTGNKDWERKKEEKKKATTKTLLMTPQLAIKQPYPINTLSRSCSWHRKYTTGQENVCPYMYLSFELCYFTSITNSTTGSKTPSYLLTYQFYYSVTTWEQ